MASNNFSRPEGRVEAILPQTKCLSSHRLYLKLPTAVVSSLQRTECEGVEQNLAQIFSVNRMHITSKHLCIQSMHVLYNQFKCDKSLRLMFG